MLEKNHNLDAQTIPACDKHHMSFMSEDISRKIIMIFTKSGWLNHWVCGHPVLVLTEYSAPFSAIEI